jgi:hypothetical protein
MAYELSVKNQLREVMSALGVEAPRRISAPLAVLPSPPIVTFLANADADAISGGIRILPRRLLGSKTTLYDVDGDPHFETIRCPQGKLLVAATDLARADFLTGGSGQAQRWPTAWILETDATRFDICTRALGSAIYYRIWVLDTASGRFLPSTLGYTSSGASSGTRFRHGATSCHHVPAN